MIENYLESEIQYQINFPCKDDIGIILDEKLNLVFFKIQALKELFNNFLVSKVRIIVKEVIQKNGNTPLGDSKSINYCEFIEIYVSERESLYLSDDPHTVATELYNKNAISKNEAIVAVIIHEIGHVFAFFLSNRNNSIEKLIEIENLSKLLCKQSRYARENLGEVVCESLVRLAFDSSDKVSNKDILLINEIFQKIKLLLDSTMR